MGRNISNKFSKLFILCYAVILALIITVTIPLTIQAADMNSNSSKYTHYERYTSIKTSTAISTRALPGDSDSAKEIVLSAEVCKMVSVINQERAKAGLEALSVDFPLVKLAQQKSQDMVNHNYFGHNSEQLGSIYDQLERARIAYQIVAENLAGAENCQKAQQYLMSSLAHRYNILNPYFTKVGIGVSRGGPYGEIITQLFLR